MPAPRRRSCPATARSPICSGRMTHPAPLRPSPVPSISRLFAAAFLAIAVAGLAERVAIWRSARRTQADMIELSQRLEQLARLSPSPALEPEIVAMRELAAEVGDNAIQAAAQTTVIFVIVLVALGVGLWYNRRRLATPFAHVVGALQRVAAGRYEERLDEDQPEEFGTIAHGVNQMAAALSWRERMQDQAGRLLSALNAPPREASAGGSFGPALDVIAGATGAPALALYQPQYDTNEWGPTAVRRATARPLSRDVVRQLVGDTVTVIYWKRRGGARADAAAARHGGRRCRRGAGARPAALPGSARGLARRNRGWRALRRRARRARARRAEPGHCLRARVRAPAYAPPGGGGAPRRAAPRVAERRARGPAPGAVPPQRRARPGGQTQGPVPRERVARASDTFEQRDRVQRLAPDDGDTREPPHRDPARLPGDHRAQRPPPARAHQRAAGPVEDRGRHDGAAARAAGAGRPASGGRRHRPCPARSPAAHARDRAFSRPPRGHGRPGTPPPGASQPALQRHQVLDRWRPRHAQRAARGLWRGAGRRERQRHRDRPGGSAKAVSGVRAARREREPPLRRDGPRPRALETPSGAARRHHRRGVGARQG